VLSLLSLPVLAGPTIFGMELGKMTEKELKDKYNVNRAGTNKYSDGNMYSVPVSSIKFEGLQEVTAIFSKDGQLVGVLTTLHKKKFDYLKKILDGKYKRVSQKTPFVGNKEAIYRAGDTEILLTSHHLSFKMSMNYINDDLMQVFNRQSEAEAHQKQQGEASQL